LSVESHDPEERANLVLNREKMLPVAFIIIYMLYFVITLVMLWAKLKA
jgi:predicted nucleic acid-binding Zn ribbon protein